MSASSMRTIWRVEIGGIRVGAGTGSSTDFVVTVAVAVPGAVTGLVTVHEPCGMVPEHASATEPANPPTDPTVTVKVAGFPRVAVTVAGAVTVKSSTVPLNASVC